MKVGQALVVMEAAIPEEFGGALSRGADQAAGRRAADARGQGAQGARRSSWAPSGVSGSSPSTTPRSRRPASGRCTGRCGPTDARWPSRCSTPAPTKRCAPTSRPSQRIGRPVRSGRRPAPMCVRSSRSSPSAPRKNSTTGSKPTTSAHSPRHSRTIPSSSSRGRRQRPEGGRHRMDDGITDVQDHPRAERRAAQCCRCAARRVPLRVTGARRPAALRSAPREFHVARRRPDGCHRFRCGGPVPGRAVPSGTMVRWCATRSTRTTTNCCRPWSGRVHPEGRAGVTHEIDDMLASVHRTIAVRVFHYTRKWLQTMTRWNMDISVAQIKTARQMDIPAEAGDPDARHRARTSRISCQLDAHVPTKAHAPSDQVRRWRFAAPPR